MSGRRAAISERRSRCSGSGSIEAKTIRWVAYPVSIASTFRRLRINSPAPASSSTETAACTTTNAPRSRVRWRASPRAPPFSARTRSGWLAWKAGIAPAPTPASSATSSVNARTCRLIVASAQRVSGISMCRSTAAPSNATPIATTPPHAAAIPLSISSRRMSRRRLTPSARRTAISRRRCIPRASSRLATLAHAIRSMSNEMTASRAAIETPGVL